MPPFVANENFVIILTIFDLGCVLLSFKSMSSASSFFIFSIVIFYAFSLLGDSEKP